MTLTRLRRALALTLSLTLAAGLALVAAPAALAAPSNDATLSSITVSTGTITTPFSSDPNIPMAITLPNAVSHLAFTPTASDPGATILAFNAWDAKYVLASGIQSKPGFVAAGATVTMTAEVTAADGVTTAQYRLLVTREATPAPVYNLDLDGLTVSEGTLSPAFSSATTGYTVDVPYTTTSITVTPGASAGNTVVVTNSGNEVGETIRLGVGTNLALVTVTAPDSTSRQYTVHITRGPAPTADVDLADIELSIGTLSPAFDPATLQYSATVPYATRSMQITLTASTPGHTITINNAVITDGAPATVSLGFGPSGNSFGISITAANGASKNYVVVITRAQPSSNADLTGLSLSNATISPAFSNGEVTYTATVPYLTTSTTVTGVVADATAILRINGHDTASGTASAPIALAVGANTITVSATAEDGVTETTRTVNVTRAAPDLDLSALTVTGGDLSPAFDAATTAYTLALPFDVASVDVAASAANPDWTLAIQGTETAGASLAVPVGASTISVTVTALYGETREYTIAVTRQAPSANADLAGITLSDGTLSPAFAAGTTEYTATVGYLTEQITVNAAAAEATTSLTVNGTPVASAIVPPSVPLAVGENTITIVATAQDGVTVKTTTVVVTREAAPSPSVTFALGFVAGDSAADAPLSVGGTNLRPGSTATITMHSTPVVLATGTVKADGTITLTARIPANAESGAHRLVFDGTAMDGTALSTTAWFTVLRDGTIGAVSTTDPVEYVEPKPTPTTDGGTASGGTTALASTGADAGLGAMAAAGLGILGALMLLLAGLRRRRAA
ncbi:cadherin-like protein [Microterricola gilva]|uniref:Cadherin-like protein n=1 Tax=Microterricola gilva TaxID=393267 RepID=A0A4Q8APZ9_9MICO|nr:cadherin-like beta sandwich domain-containing protein [Microterricola gilva]RZU66782.1 cadherin-like protein [Microterricola gilva]